MRLCQSPHRAIDLARKGVLMLKAALAAAFGLAVIGHSMVLGKDRPESRQDSGSAVQDRGVLTSAEIIHIKTVCADPRAGTVSAA